MLINVFGFENRGFVRLSIIPTNWQPIIGVIIAIWHTVIICLCIFNFQSTNTAVSPLLSPIAKKAKLFQRLTCWPVSEFVCLPHTRLSLPAPTLLFPILASVLVPRFHFTCFIFRSPAGELSFTRNKYRTDIEWSARYELITKIVFIFFPPLDVFLIFLCAKKWAIGLC